MRAEVPPRADSREPVLAERELRHRSNGTEPRRRVAPRTSERAPLRAGPPPRRRRSQVQSPPTCRTVPARPRRHINHRRRCGHTRLRRPRPRRSPLPQPREIRRLQHRPQARLQAAGPRDRLRRKTRPLGPAQEARIGRRVRPEQERFARPRPSNATAVGIDMWTSSDAYTTPAGRRPSRVPSPRAPSPVPSGSQTTHLPQSLDVLVRRTHASRWTTRGARVRAARSRHRRRPCLPCEADRHGPGPARRGSRHARAPLSATSSARTCRPPRSTR